jgi:hypothetical protein
MGDRARRASTQPFAAGELEQLAQRSRDRQTCKVHTDELVDLATRSLRAPRTVKFVDRPTQQIDPTHFRLMLLSEREQLPLAPADIVHMQPEEAEAWLAMRPVAATGALEVAREPEPTRRAPAWPLRFVASVLAAVLAVVATLLVIAS